MHVISHGLDKNVRPIIDTLQASIRTQDIAQHLQFHRVRLDNILSLLMSPPSVRGVRHWKSQKVKVRCGTTLRIGSLGLTSWDTLA